MMSHISIQNRMLLTVVVGLFALFITHVALLVFHSQMVYYDTEKQLSEYAMNFTSSSVYDGNELIFTMPPPDSRFIDEGSGLGAAIFVNNKLLWLSPSVNRFPVTLSYPLSPDKKTIRQSVFEPGTTAHSFHRFMTPAVLNNSNDKIDVFVFEDAAPSLLQIEAFREATFAALLCAFIMILAAQTVAARWSTRPVFRMVEELKQIRKGNQTSFKGQYPSELQEVGQSVNDLIQHEAKTSETYKHTLSNLAHSLKTPLAVLRNSLESPDDDALRSNLLQQISKIDNLVSYQLSMASRGGNATFAPPLKLEPLATDIVEGLEKINSQKGAFCEFEIQENVQANMSQGDAQELLGNLLDNAFKWCQQRVLLTMSNQNQETLIQVEDDGSGVPPEKISVIMERGIRADEHVQGHGIGLAIVADIVRSYGGTFDITRSDELGGACFKAIIPLSQK